MTDILGAVNDFLLTYVGKGETLPLLEQPQIVRGWQNAVSALPSASQEYAVLTLLNSVRHGTNVRQWRDDENSGGVIETITRLGESMVQVDFCCASPQQGEYISRTRAEILELLTRDSVAVDFFKPYGISACYADDPRALPFQNEAEQWIARYSVTMHLTHWVSVDVPRDAFDQVNIYLENVDIHHPITEENQS